MKIRHLPRTVSYGILCLAVSAVFNFRLSGQCPEFQGELGAVGVLTARSADRVPDADRECVRTALVVLEGAKSARNIPLLISYLSFRRDDYLGEKEGFMTRAVVEGDRYPAVLALAETGHDAYIPLVMTVESASSTPLVRHNASHAILIGKRELSGLGSGLEYLRDAEVATNAEGKKAIEDALQFLLTVPTCALYKSECEAIVLKGAQH